MSPDQCSYHVTDSHIILSLAKREVGTKWKSLTNINPIEGQSTKIEPTDTDHKWRAISPEHQNDKPVNNYNDLNTVDQPTTNQNNSVYISNEFNPFKLASKAAPPLTLSDSVFGDDQLPTNDVSEDNSEQTVTDRTNKTTASVTSQPNSLSTSEELKKEMKPVSRAFYRLSPDSFDKPSLIGIANMGNTCFMSSVLQCLSNTVEVRDYFLGGVYKKDINLVNPLGRQGKLAECFSDCLVSLWKTEKAYINPWKLKVL